MPLFAENVPKSDRAAAEGKIRQLHLLHAGSDLRILGPRLADTAEVALDVGGEDRNADPAEALGHHLQCNCLPRAGGAGDEPMAISHV